MPKKTKKTLAIIGSGPGGMACGHFLHDKFDILVYEKNDYVGGHACTVAVEENGSNIYTDTAFVIFNPKSYPLFTRFLDKLKVPSMECPMHMSVVHKPSGLEYALRGSHPSLRRIFCHPINLCKPSFWNMLFEIKKFNQHAVKILKKPGAYAKCTILEYVKKEGYSDDFFFKYLLPLSSTLWITDPAIMVNFPAVAMIRSLDNHDLLPRLLDNGKWRTIIGGSRMYRDRAIEPFRDKILINTAVTSVERKNGKVVVTDSQGGKRTFDHAIVNCHPPEALQIVKNPTALERELLGAIPYHKSKVFLHTDPAVMPKKRVAWSGWNYRVESDKNGKLGVTHTYYMNYLQKVSEKKDYFLTIGEATKINPSKIIRTFDQMHLSNTFASTAAIPRLHELNQDGPIYYCGGYFGHGYHEDSFRSGLEVCRLLTGKKVF